ncbi:MAG: fibronectin type III domain-containing protein [candidate division WOR-3 bacterium]|nr:MAG: fibronectin type III domain-containing protein [candidate division WOR-3 bacterium]
MFLLFFVLAQGVIDDVDVVNSTDLIEKSEAVHTIVQAPPTQIYTRDRANDAGGGIVVFWKKSEDDGAGRESVIEYHIYRGTEADGDFELVGTAKAGDTSYTDITTRDGTPYYYQVKAFDGEQHSSAAVSEAAYSSAQWFHTGRISMLIATILISTFVVWFINKAKRGHELYIRPIAGLEAVDDAVGRATEMGKPIMYVPGILDMDNIQTIASMIILGRVARKAAEYETAILVPCTRSIVMSAAQEMVKEAYLEAGRPDAYDADKIQYLTDDQFGYAAGVDGMLLREKPGAIFYLGGFYAESLILAETGHSTGAIQIAGTAQPSQLPFFVTACDYTLIGEEMFAASAYLSKEPLLLGGLKGQDWGKAIIIFLILVGVLLVTLGFTDVIGWLSTGQ